MYNAVAVVLTIEILRSDLCTGAITRDFSWWNENDEHILNHDYGGSYGSPCYGDWGTALMTKENKRYKQ